MKKLLQSESWKKTAVLGWVLTLVAGTRYALTGGDIPPGVISLVGVLVLGAGAWQGIKRGTQWKPTEEAKAEQMRNGLGDDDGIDH